MRAEATRTPNPALEPAPHSLHEALLLHEAAVLVNFHSQDVGVQNIRPLVLIVLDLSSSQYTRWHGRVCSSSPWGSSPSRAMSFRTTPTQPSRTGRAWTAWSSLGSTVPSSPSCPTWHHVPAPQPSARSVWLAVKSQFLGNLETGALYLNSEFRTFAQGASPSPTTADASRAWLRG